MSGKWKSAILAVILVIGLPRLIYAFLSIMNIENEFAIIESEYPIDITLPNIIHVSTNDGVVSMDIDEYLIGVLLCEIPGEFHLEAQKAQAVVARTYAMQTTLFKNKHKDNAICTDPGCCQGYFDLEDFLLAGGNQKRIDIATEAVKDTQGQVLIYEGNLIDATYFSCSGGKTEDAVAVWGEAVPYLQSVSSPGEEGCAYYQDSVVFSAEEFQNILGHNLQGTPGSWFGTINYTRGGGVESIRIGGILYTGTNLRSLFGLRSTAFTITTLNDTITITTKGFGHRVGMSQYGANAMALLGEKYPAILAHYYPGTVIDKGNFIG